MQEGQPTHKELYEIIGSVYSDAYLRITFLEKENKKLRESYQEIVNSLAILRKDKDTSQCTSGKGNIMLPELSQEPTMLESGKTNSISSPPLPNND